MTQGPHPADRSLQAQSPIQQEIKAKHLENRMLTLMEGGYDFMDTVVSRALAAG